VNAGEKLVLLSGLLSGSALIHLIAAQSGSGFGLVVSDGIAVDISLNPYLVDLPTMDIDVQVSIDPVEAEVPDNAIEVEVVSDQTELELP